MRPFAYVRANNENDAIQALIAGDAGAEAPKLIAGGTTLLDLMKLGVEAPSQLIDVNRLALADIAATEGNAPGLRIGSMARNTEVAEHPLVRSKYRMLSEALLSGASPQLRNMASVGGNLLQRTRCSYFRDLPSEAPCNKRSPGSGCSAMGGFNRMHAVLGVSDKCIAAHPSDMCVALAALDAQIVLHGPKGNRQIAMTDLHTLPGDHPEIETTLQPGELIVAVLLQEAPYFARSRYVKVRDRASYAFALTSAAVALDVQEGTIKAARIALGGVGTKPWRALTAEQALVGQPATVASYRAAAETAMQGAIGHANNTFKIDLAKRTLVRALTLTAGAT